MTNHYYNNNLETKSRERLVKYHVFNKELTFITDHGVFSKDAIDYGTRVLIENVEIKPEYKKVLDIGCGYGPIGISLAKGFPFVHFDLIDINLRALDLARRNAQLNNLQNISIFESNIYEMINTKYDCIISNPPIRAGKKIVHQIIEEAIKYLVSSGAIYIVIQKKQGAKSAYEKLKQTFDNCEIACRDKGYYLLRSIKKLIDSDI